MLQKVQKNKKGRIKRAFRRCMIFLLLLALSAAILYLGFRVRNVKVIGSDHYSEEQIKEILLTGEAEKNSLFLFFKYKYFTKPVIPFIEDIDIELVNPVTIKINVYEKIITGCVDHMGQYLYFDKDGIIVESSTTKIEFVPLIEGLKYDKLVINEKLHIQKEAFFDIILEITQLIKKYKLDIDKVIFLSNGEVKLVSGNIRILLGKREVYDAQIANLQNIYPEMEGLSGELDMRNIKEGKNKFVFKQD